MKLFKTKFQQNDFDENKLPSSRKGQFFDILKHRKSLLFKMSFILILFLLPFFISVIVKDSMLASVDLSLEKDVLKDKIFNISLIYTILVSISLLIFFVGLSGVAKIYKRLLWREPIFIKEDFFSGIKENCFNFIVFGLINSIFFSFSLIISYFTDSLFQYLPVGLNIVFVCPVVLIALFLICFYKNSFISNIKISIEFYLKNPLFTLLFVLMSFGMFQIKYIKYIYIKYLLVGLIIVFILPFFLLLMFEYYTYKFDELINKDKFVNFYKKGLNKKL